MVRRGIFSIDRYMASSIAGCRDVAEMRGEDEEGLIVTGDLAGDGQEPTDDPAGLLILSGGQGESVDPSRSLWRLTKSSGEAERLLRPFLPSILKSSGAADEGEVGRCRNPLRRPR